MEHLIERRLGNKVHQLLTKIFYVNGNVYSLKAIFDINKNKNLDNFFNSFNTKKSY